MSKTIIQLHSNRAPALKTNPSEGEEVANVIGASSALAGEPWREAESSNPRKSSLDALEQAVDIVASKLAALPGRLLKPAELIDIATAVDKFIAGYPQRAADPAAYAEGLCEEIACVGPSRAGLVAGLRELQKTMKLLPSRAELRDALIRSQKSIAGLPERLTFRRNQIQDARRRVAELEEWTRMRGPQAPEQ